MRKKCKHCHELKPLDSFYAHAQMADGRLNVCKPCRDAYVAQWSAKNRERRRAIARAWAANRRTPARSAASFSKWYAKQQANGGLARMCERVRKRTAAIGLAAPEWRNDFFIEEIYDLARLRTAVTGVAHEVDHIVPLQSPLVCGLHTEANLRVITAIENGSKGNRRWPDMPSAA